MKKTLLTILAVSGLLSESQAMIPIARRQSTANSRFRIVSRPILRFSRAANTRDVKVTAPQATNVTAATEPQNAQATAPQATNVAAATEPQNAQATARRATIVSAATEPQNAQATARRATNVSAATEPQNAQATTVSAAPRSARIVSRRSAAPRFAVNSQREAADHPVNPGTTFRCETRPPLAVTFNADRYFRIGSSGISCASFHLSRLFSIDNVTTRAPLILTGDMSEAQISAALSQAFGCRVRVVR